MNSIKFHHIILLTFVAGLTIVSSTIFTNGPQIYTITSGLPPFLVTSTDDYILFGGTNQYQGLNLSTYPPTFTQVLNNLTSICDNTNQYTSWYPTIFYNAYLEQYLYICTNQKNVYVLDHTFKILKKSNLSNEFYYDEIKFLDLPADSVVAFFAFKNEVNGGKYNISGNTRIYTNSALIYFDMKTNQVTKNFTVNGIFNESLISAAYYKNDTYFALGQSTDPINNNQNVFVYLFDVTTNSILQTVYQYTLPSNAGPTATFFKPDVFCPNLDYVVFTTPYGMVAVNINTHNVTIASLQSSSYVWTLPGPWNPFGPKQLLLWTDMPVQPILDGTYFLHYDSTTGKLAIVDIKHMNSIEEVGFIPILEKNQSYNIQSFMTISNETVVLNIGKNYNTYVYNFVQKNLTYVFPNDVYNQGYVYNLNGNLTAQILQTGVIVRDSMNQFINFYPIDYNPLTYFQNPYNPAQFYFIIDNCNMIHYINFANGQMGSDVLNYKTICQSNYTFRVLSEPGDSWDWYISATDSYHFYLQNDDLAWNLYLPKFNVSDDFTLVDYFIDWNKTLIAIVGIQNEELISSIVNYHDIEEDVSPNQIILSNMQDIEIVKRANWSTLMALSATLPQITLDFYNPFNGSNYSINMESGSSKITKVNDILQLNDNVYSFYVNDNEVISYNGTDGSILQDIVFDSDYDIKEIYSDGNSGFSLSGVEELFRLYKTYDLDIEDTLNISLE